MTTRNYLFPIVFALILLIFSSNIAQASEKTGENGIPILLYHHILKSEENPFKNNSAVINLEAFEEQVKYLNDEGYYTATASELISYLRGETSLPSKTVVITFDDGHKTNYLYAYPVLKKYGFRATNFLITNRISETPVPFNPDGLQFLSWPEINEMRDVFEYGAHTHNLHFVSETTGSAALISEPEDVIIQDLTTSREILNTNLFAYPFGAYNQRAIDLLKTAGYEYAFTTVSIDAKKSDNPFEIGRKGVFPSTSMQEFKKLLSSKEIKTGWQKNGDKWSYLSDQGEAVRGWVKDKNKWYYLDDTGWKTDWAKVNGKWYYFNKKGEMTTGWLKWGKDWFYLHNSGDMATNWIKDSNTWYHLKANGAMSTGWLKSGGYWYHLNTNGMMSVGWKRVNNDWFYFYKDGHMAANTVISGFIIDKDGKWKK